MKLPRGYTWRRVSGRVWPNALVCAMNLYSAHLPGPNWATFIACMAASLSITTTFYYLRALHRLARIEGGNDA